MNLPLAELRITQATSSSSGEKEVDGRKVEERDHRAASGDIELETSLSYSATKGRLGSGRIVAAFAGGTSADQSPKRSRVAASMGCLEAAMVPLVGDEVRRGYTGINSLNLRIVCSSPYRPTKHIERTIHKYEEYNTIHPKRGSLGRCSVVGPMPLGRASGTLLADIGIPWWKRQGRSTGVPGRPGVGISQQAPTNPLRAPREYYVFGAHSP